MNCQDVRKRLDAWVDGEMPASETERITGHLENCAKCRQHAGALRRMTTALDRLPPLKTPAGLSQRTMQAFRKGIERPGLAEWWRELSLAMRSAVCGTALAGLICGAVLGTSLLSLTPDSGTSLYQTLYISEGFYP